MLFLVLATTGHKWQLVLVKETSSIAASINILVRKMQRVMHTRHPALHTVTVSLCIAGVLAAQQEAAVDSPANYLASYCTATSGPCINHEQPVGSAAPQVLRLRCTAMRTAVPFLVQMLTSSGS